jgi:hypothetical protein
VAATFLDGLVLTP